jgi:hypothetical protein
MRFSKWLDTFLSEKEIDTEEVLEVEASDGTPNHIPVGSLVDLMKSAPAHEQAGIRSMIVRIDFANGDVRRYLRHLARAVAIPTHAPDAS